MNLEPPVKLKPPRRSFYPMLNGVFYGLVFAGLFSAVVFVFATPPTSKYDFAATLDPNCTPGSTNCSVVSPVPYTGSTAAVSLGAYDFTVDTSTLYVDSTNNRVGIGTTSPSATLHLNKTGTDTNLYNIYSYLAPTATTGTNDFLAIRNEVVSTITGNSTNYIIGLDNNVYNTNISSGVTDSGYRMGVRGDGYIGNSSSAGTLANSTGVMGRAGINLAAAGAVVTTAYAIRAAIMNNVANTTITNAYGLYIEAAGTTGTITNNYGIYQTGTVEKNYFGGSVGIRTTGPDRALEINNASGNNLRLTYNDSNGSASNYADLLTTSGGNLTITPSGGLINIGSATGMAMSATNGVLTMAGLKSSGNNENLTFDFETTANTVAVTSTTGVSNITWTGNLTLGGNTTVGTLVTRVATSAPTEADVNGSLVVESGDGGRLYFRYGGAWHYVAQTAGFQIPNLETIDPISGEQIEEGDVVLGMVDKTLEDKALHGIWVKWDSVKAQLLAEARGELSKTGTWGTGAISDVKTETLLDKVTNVLFSLGISAKDGVTSITQLAVERFSAKNARVETLEMIDKTTGEIYCTWVENGELIKAKGECGSIEVAIANPQPVGQSIEQAEQIIQQAQQAANNALETTQLAQEAVEETVRRTAEQAVREQIHGQIQEQVQQEVQEQLQEVVPVPAPESEPAEEHEMSDVSPAGETSDINATSAPAELAPEPSPIEGAGEIIQDAAAGLLQSMLEFANWLFGISFNQISKLVPNTLEESTAGILETDFKIISDGIKSIKKIIK